MLRAKCREELNIAFSFSSREDWTKEEKRASSVVIHAQDVVSSYYDSSFPVEVVGITEGAKWTSAATSKFRNLLLNSQVGIKAILY